MHKENAIRKQLTGGGVALIHYTSTYQTRSPLLKWGQQSGQPYFPPFKKLLFRENYHVPDSTSSPFQLAIVILNNKCSVPWPQNFANYLPVPALVLEGELMLLMSWGRREWVMLQMPTETCCM